MFPPPIIPPSCPLCGSPLPACACGMTPARDPAPAPALPSRFVKKGFYICCARCGLEVSYCRGHSPPDAQSNDGSESGLARRIREARGGR